VIAALSGSTSLPRRGQRMATGRCVRGWRGWICQPDCHANSPTIAIIANARTSETRVLLGSLSQATPMCTAKAASAPVA